MSNTPEFIRAKLVSRTNANTSEQKVKNNRFHYILTFNESIGWDWLYGQVRKAQAELETDLELWEIHPSAAESFKIEVREVGRRPEIDDSQHGLSEFES